MEEAAVARWCWNVFRDVRRCFLVFEEGECNVGRSFGWLAGVGEDDGAKGARKLGRPVGVYVGVRGWSGIALRGVYGFGSLWMPRKMTDEVWKWVSRVRE